MAVELFLGEAIWGPWRLPNVKIFGLFENFQSMELFHRLPSIFTFTWAPANWISHEEALCKLIHISARGEWLEHNTFRYRFYEVCKWIVQLSDPNQTNTANLMVEVEGSTRPFLRKYQKKESQVRDSVSTELHELFMWFWREDSTAVNQILSDFIQLLYT